MNRLVLGNAAYRKLFGICKGHMTDEQAQLQDGLVHAGWTIAGPSFNPYKERYLPAHASIIEASDVRTILDKAKFDTVFIQDPRDMQAESGGCFDKWTNFYGIGALKHYSAYKVVSFKDAAVAIDYQRDFAASVGASALATYYHRDSIKLTSVWAEDYIHIRHYHCVDADYIKTLNLYKDRRRGLVSGHTSPFFYPLRHEVVRRAHSWNIDVQPHPGWNNHGCRVPEYLELLTHYKVHVATCTRYGHALRKIIESVCCGCACVTNLPEYDCLPVIDDWLIRIPLHAEINQVREAIDKAESEWNQEQAIARAEAACDYYDFKADAKRLDQSIRDAIQH